MVTNQKTPLNVNGKNQQTAQFKAFVEGTGAAEHPERKKDKPAGAHQLIDQQNKLIDQHNLRK